MIRQTSSDPLLSDVAESDDDRVPDDQSDGVSAIETTPMGKSTAQNPKNPVRRHHLSSDERASLLVEFVKLGAKPVPGDVKALCNAFGVKRNY